MTKKLEEIIQETITTQKSGENFINRLALALLTSPDIAVVERDKLQKMQRVVEAIKRTIAWSQVEDDELEQALAELEG